MTYQKNGPIAISRDIRLNSEEMKESLIEEILSTGWDVIDTSIASLLFSFFSNEFKFCVGKWATYGNEIQDIRRRIKKEIIPKERGN